MPRPVSPRCLCRAFGLVFALGAVGACNESENPDSAKSERVAPPGNATTDPIQQKWRPLAKDGLHDPDNPLLHYLQEPSEALSVLPEGGPNGNQVDWIKALREGHIAPRTNIAPETKIRVLDLDIVFPDTAGQPQVVFPHRQHTEWLDCANCHENLFKSRRGANDISMLDILQGEYCGRCHGAVAFPLTECKRCHSRDHDPLAEN